MTVVIHQGDCREVLRSLPDESVHCVVTSPPYWGLRDYGTAKWEGGGQACDHRKPANGSDPTEGSTLGGGKKTTGHTQESWGTACRKCGARRIDSQLGLEQTPDQYVAGMVEVFREVRRVLRSDGTLWLNLGDSYAAQRSGTTPPAETLAGGINGKGEGDAKRGRKEGYNPSRNASGIGLKHKDLVGIPWRVAFALQADGWVLRQEIIWGKPNPMPESVRDRCTKSHEQIFLLSKAKWIGPGEPPTWMSETDRAWLAALVDGEGTICFQSRENGDDATTWSIRLSIVNTHRGLLERVATICNVGGGPGSPSPRHRSDGQSGRPIYAWQVTNAKAAAVIAAIRPYLIAKATQADLAMAVHCLNQKHKGRGGYVTSPEDAEFKKRAAAACSALNHGEESDMSWFQPVKWGRWGSQPYYFDADAIAEQSVENDNRKPYSPGQVDARGDGHDRGGGSERTNGIRDASQRNKRSVWTVTTQPFSGAHFATFPPALIEPCILAGCPDGGVVLDPFGGAGTTGLVADRHHRNAILIELNPEYAAMAKRRIEGDSPLFAQVTA